MRAKVADNGLWLLQTGLGRHWDRINNPVRLPVCFTVHYLYCYLLFSSSGRFPTNPSAATIVLWLRCLIDLDIGTKRTLFTLLNDLYYGWQFSWKCNLCEKKKIHEARRKGNFVGKKGNQVHYSTNRNCMNPPCFSKKRLLDHSMFYFCQCLA